MCFTIGFSKWILARTKHNSASFSAGCTCAGTPWPSGQLCSGLGWEQTSEALPRLPRQGGCVQDAEPEHELCPGQSQAWLGGRAFEGARAVPGSVPGARRWGWEWPSSQPVSWPYSACWNSQSTQPRRSGREHSTECFQHTGDRPCWPWQCFLMHHSCAYAHSLPLLPCLLPTFPRMSEKSLQLYFIFIVMIQIISWVSICFMKDQHFWSRSPTQTWRGGLRLYHP